MNPAGLFALVPTALLLLLAGGGETFYDPREIDRRKTPLSVSAVSVQVDFALVPS